VSTQFLKNVSASVHQRLLSIARDTERPFNEVLQYFAMERFLHRLSRSSNADSFVLKGALLFRVWDMPDSRATRDIDFLAYVDNSPENLAAIFREVCSINDPDDGLVFDPNTVEAQRIKEDAEYEGVRTRLRGQLGKAQIVMQIDVGFGDLIHPSAVRADYPALLALPAPSLRMYPPETVIAEKAEAMVYLGSLNSRMKDFYDVWRMSQQFDFLGHVLCTAVTGTFQNRNTEVIEFDDLATDLLDNKNFDKQWAAFLRKSVLTDREDFPQVLTAIGEFLSPVFSSVKSSKAFDQEWAAPGPWRKKQR
jgi:Nucleotidyl transferase AbiEii toxin, Type IV TA system